MLKYFNLIFLMLFFSCNVICFEELQISSNADENKIYFSDEMVELIFSTEVNKNSVEKILTLKEDSSSIDVLFYWENNKCRIKPVHGFIKNTQYLIQLNGNILTEDSRKYSINFEKSFIYGTPDDLFVLENYSNPSFPDNKNQIKFNFNKPIDISSFEDNFSTNPYISVSKMYSSDLKSVTITPENNWVVNTFYTWNLNKLKSENGYILQTEYKDCFIYARDYLQPKLISSTLENTKINDSIDFTFNKQINLKSFENYFSISPSIKGYFTQNSNTITFHPLSNFEIDKEYSVSLPAKITDENNIPLYSDINRTFIPVNNFLSISQISINGIIINDYNNENIQELDVSNTDSLFIQIIFSTPIQIERQNSAEKAITLEPSFPSLTSFPKLNQITWNDSNNSVTLSYSNLTKTDIKELYKLTINSSKTYFLNENQEYMEKDICIYFFTN